jgi:hypothetical protein
MKTTWILMACLLTAATAVAQSPKIDEAETKELRTELDALGIKYWTAAVYSAPSEADLERIPEQYRPFLTNGMCVLDLHGRKGIDLKPLAKFAFTHLSLDQTDVSDISAVKEMPLVQLGLHYAPVADISPLRGKKLFEVDLRGTRVTDISALEGMPIERLDLTFTAVSNIAPVLKLPKLNTLYLSYTSVRDLRPLRQATQLRRLYLPDQIDVGMQDVRGMKWLTHLAYGDSDFLPALDFWKKYDAGELKPSARKWTPKPQPSAGGDEKPAPQP